MGKEKFKCSHTDVKKIKDWPYLVCSCGTIVNEKSENQIKQTINESGYLKVNLWKNNKYKTFKVHRIVAITFLKNEKNKKTVNHKNGIKTDNSLKNLEWNTYSENIKHSYDKLKRKPAHLGRSGNSHHRSKPVAKLLGDKIIKTYESARIASIENKLCESAVAKSASKGCRAGGNYYKWI